MTCSHWMTTSSGESTPSDWYWPRLFATGEPGMGVGAEVEGGGGEHAWTQWHL
jgi:hypothetical protein